VIFMKRLFAGIAASIAAAILFLNSDVNAYSAQRMILLDAKTGRVLYEQSADEKSLIASTTKIMTALVVCEQCNVLDRVRIPKEAVGIEGSSMYLQEDEILTVQELLYGMMLSSGNDAATALAIYCGGTVEGFAQLMNDKAHNLGLKNTHFENPHGLDSPDHYSTAEDLATLAAYAMEDPIFRKTVSTKQVTLGHRSLRNHNKLLWRFDGADGIKTGYTKAAGRILVSSAIRDDRRLVAVTINAPDDWNDHCVLLEAGFSKYKSVDLIQKGTVLGYTEVAGGVKGQVELLAASDFSYSLAENETVIFKRQDCGFVYAPIVAGQDAGYIYVLVDGSFVGKVPLVFGDTVEQKAEVKATIWQRLLGRKTK